MRGKQRFPVPVTSPPDSAPVSAADVSVSGDAKKHPEQPAPYDLIELFFFAYRDFVSDPDRILADYGFGRAHHRVLHFVERRPGLTIAELLDILKITKQSLNRVLKELVETGFVRAQEGREDRRQRLLFTTESGHDLAGKLAALQGERIARALNGASDTERATIARYLMGLIEPSDRATVEELIRQRV
ncbi:MAG: MarR family winged helix-turn-helix transcriptional regulator [Bosea sp. (in: a-proteobacteria)]